METDYTLEIPNLIAAAIGTKERLGSVIDLPGNVGIAAAAQISAIDEAASAAQMALAEHGAAATSEDFATRVTAQIALQSASAALASLVG